MSFVSYAQNFEDVMLWRALRQVERGFYIDVGAWSPDLDSVTRAFSDRGWRGINIEPNPYYFAQLVEKRPSDINLSVAVGEHEGSIVMNFVAESGLSTADEAIARDHAAAGWSMTSSEVALTTLSAIWAEHVPASQEVHFLKVDVEGLEKAVLAGSDWNRNRPWIVVVEATLPASQIESHAEWEAILLDAAYVHAYSDGLNRFYVAQEHIELLEALKYPPNVFDGVVSAELQTSREQFRLADDELRASREQLRQVNDELGASREQLRLADHELSAALRRIDRLEGHLVESRRRIELTEMSAIEARKREQDAYRRESKTQAENAAKIDEMRREIVLRDAMIADCNNRITMLAQHNQVILTSTSWRLTSPMRRLAASIPRPVWRHLRRAAKAAWWGVTPWRLPARLRFIRERNQAAADVPDPPAPMVPVAAPTFDLMSDEALLKTSGLPSDEVLWRLQPAGSIGNKYEAARFCIDLLRRRPEIRARFPLALSEPDRSGFVQWLTSEGEGSAELGLSRVGKALLKELLHCDFGAQARQIFLFRADVRAELPHGLTPPGQPGLFRWFMQTGRHEAELGSEEILWLFLQAAEQPALEVVRAFLFTPEWQKLHPDGLTVFGRDAFSSWFQARYQVAASANWVQPEKWPVGISAGRQLRQAYYAREAWRQQHPYALSDLESAEAFVLWLGSEASSLPDGLRDWCASLDPLPIAQELVAGGVNLIGHFCCPSGVRVSAEALVKGLTGLGIETSLRDLRTDIKDEPRHVQFDGLEDFDVTIVHTQPEPFFGEAYRRSDLHERSPKTYRIAYWYWEFDTVPQSWVERAREVDEVWTATEFVAKGLREQLSIPVKTMFPGVELGPYQRRDRRYFGIEEGTFAFLFSFHMNSVMERKNPLGLIRAFKSAFAAEEPVTLVLKTMFGSHHPEQLQQLRDAAAGARIQVIDQTYSADEVLSLTDACDAYVSLHRSEGLGLTMAEAMLMGKPVIATNYSGNIDFMDESNSLLVPYELVKLGRPLPPYEADFSWAEPSIEHAAALMRRVVDEPDWARALGQRARAIAEVSLSVRTAGQKVAQRLSQIKAMQAPPLGCRQ